MSTARYHSAIRIKKPLKVLVCLVTLVAFFINIFSYDLAFLGSTGSVAQAWAAESSSGLPGGGSDSIGSPGVFKQLNVETFSLPEYLGHVKDSWVTKGRGSWPVVLHIQDAHCNYAAQHKIAEIVEYLNREYGIDTVNLEGGAKEYDLSIFTNIKDKGLRSKAADYFVKEGLVNGAEYYAINNPGKIDLWGIEDTNLYIDNLKVYRSSLGNKEEIDKHLKDLSFILTNLKIKMYSPELLELDTKYSQYKAGNLEFKDYLAYLVLAAKKNAIGSDRFANIDIVSRTLTAESDIDFKTANSQRDELIDRLQKKLSKRSLEELVAKTVDFRAQRISQNDFYSYLVDISKHAQIDIKDLPDLQKYIAYISMYSAIDKMRIIDELDKLEDAVKDSLYQNDKQRRLNKLSKNLAILKNLFTIALTRDDYKYYTDNEDSFSTAVFTSFIDQQAPLYKITTSLDNNITNLDRYREEMARFYKYSFSRDEAFVRNTRFASNKNTPSANRATLLVTGGFHAENLEELFRKQGISYISIMPSFKNCEGYECPYFNILSGKNGIRIKDALPLVVNKALAIPDQLNPAIVQAVSNAGLESGIGSEKRELMIKAEHGAKDRDIDFGNTIDSMKAGRIMAAISLTAMSITIAMLWMYSYISVGQFFASGYLVLGSINVLLMPLAALCINLTQDTIIRSVASILYPKKLYLGNSKYYSINPKAKPEGMAWPNVTLQMPVYNEDFDDVVEPTLISMIAARDRYIEKVNSDGQDNVAANIVVYDDGIMPMMKDDIRLYADLVKIVDAYPKGSLDVSRLTSEIKKIALPGQISVEDLVHVAKRLHFYRDHSIGYVCRQSKDRKGYFKKASNMNFGMVKAIEIDTAVRQYMKQNKITNYEDALFSVLRSRGPPLGIVSGDISLGDFFMLLDCDSIVHKDIIAATIPEFLETPSLGYTQHRNRATNSDETYFSKNMSRHMDMLYNIIFRSTARWGGAPIIMGHGCFLRRAALEAIAGDEGEGKKYWDENNVSEDLNATIRIKLKGFIGRYVAYPGMDFGESASRTYGEEAKRIKKFAFGAAQTIFNSPRAWVRGGVFTATFRDYLKSPNISISEKYNIVTYLTVYCSATCIVFLVPALIGFILFGSPMAVSVGLSVNGLAMWAIILSAIRVANNLYVRYTMSRIDGLRVAGETGKNILSSEASAGWIDLIFYGGTMLHIASGFIAHLAMRAPSWPFTPKDRLKNKDAAKSAAEIISHNRLQLALFSLVVGMAVISTIMIPTISWYSLSATLFLSINHLLAPFLLDPVFMRGLKRALNTDLSIVVAGQRKPEYGKIAPKGLVPVTAEMSRRDFILLVLELAATTYLASIGLEGMGGAKALAGERADYKESVAGMASWLTAHTGRATGLPFSHVGGTQFSGRCFTYDAAIAAEAYLYSGHITEAKRILDYFIRTDGIWRLGGIITAVNASVPVGGTEWMVRAGPNAQMGIAAYHLYCKTGERKYLDLALRLADFLLSIQNGKSADVNYGAIRSGPLGSDGPKDQHVDWNESAPTLFGQYSMEESLEAFALFNMLTNTTSGEKYRGARDRIFTWLKKVGYNRQMGYFNRGYKEKAWGVDPRGPDIAFATDAQSWAISSLGYEWLEKIEKGLAGRLMSILETKAFVTVKYRGKTVKGADFVENSRSAGRPQMVSPEWTAQVANAFFRLARDAAARGDQSRAAEYGRKGEKVVADILAMASKKGGQASLPYATLRNTQTGHGFITPDCEESAIGTAYTMLAMLKVDPFIVPAASGRPSAGPRKNIIDADEGLAEAEKQELLAFARASGVVGTTESVELPGKGSININIALIEYSPRDQIGQQFNNKGIAGAYNIVDNDSPDKTTYIFMQTGLSDYDIALEHEKLEAAWRARLQHSPPSPDLLNQLAANGQDPIERASHILAWASQIALHQARSEWKTVEECKFLVDQLASMTPDQLEEIATQPREIHNELISHFLGNKSAKKVVNFEQTVKRRILGILRNERILHIGDFASRTDIVKKSFLRTIYMKHLFWLIEPMIVVGMTAPLWIVLTSLGYEHIFPILAAMVSWLRYISWQRSHVFSGKERVLTVVTFGFTMALYELGLWHPVTIALATILIGVGVVLNQYPISIRKTHAEKNFFKALIGVAVLVIMIIHQAALPIISASFLPAYAIKLPRPIIAIEAPIEASEQFSGADVVIDSGKADRLYWKDLLKDYPADKPIKALINISRLDRLWKTGQLQHLFNELRAQPDILYRYLSEIARGDHEAFARYFATLRPGIRQQIFHQLYKRLRTDLFVLENAGSAKYILVPADYRALADQCKRLEHLYAVMVATLNRRAKQPRGVLPDAPIAPLPILGFTENEATERLSSIMISAIKEYKDNGYKVIMPLSQNVNIKDITQLIGYYNANESVTFYKDNKSADLLRWVMSMTDGENPIAHRINDEELFREAMRLCLDADNKTVDLFMAIATIGHYFKSMARNPELVLGGQFARGPRTGAEFVKLHHDPMLLVFALDPNGSNTVDDNGLPVIRWRIVDSNGNDHIPQGEHTGVLWQAYDDDLYHGWGFALTAYYARYKSLAEIAQDIEGDDLGDIGRRLSDPSFMTDDTRALTFFYKLALLFGIDRIGMVKSRFGGKFDSNNSNMTKIMFSQSMATVHDMGLVESMDTLPVFVRDGRMLCNRESLASYFLELVTEWQEAGKPSFAAWEKNDPKAAFRAFLDFEQIERADKRLKSPFNYKDLILASENFTATDIKYMPVEQWLKRGVFSSFKSAEPFFSEVSNFSECVAIRDRFLRDQSMYMRCRVAATPGMPPALLESLSRDPSLFVRCNAAFNPGMPIAILNRLSHDQSMDVRSNVASNPSTSAEALDGLSHDRDARVRIGVASNPSTSAEALDGLSHDRDARVRIGVASNLGTSITTLNHLWRDDSSTDVVVAAMNNPNYIYEGTQGSIMSKAIELITNGYDMVNDLAESSRSSAGARKHASADDEEDATLAAGKYRKPLHGDVHTAVVDGLPEDLQGFKAMTPADQKKALDKYRDADGQVVIPIDNLMRRTGILGHIGLGQFYEEPVVYVDSYFNQAGKEEMRQRVKAHEQYEIEQWIRQKEYVEKEVFKREISHPEMRQWIRDNSNKEGTGPAQVLAEAWHGRAPPIDDIYKTDLKVRMDVQNYRLERALNWLRQVIVQNQEEWGRVSEEVTGQPLDAGKNFNLEVVERNDAFSAIDARGKITSSLEYCEALNDDELAWMLGHEMAHRYIDNKYYEGEPGSWRHNQRAIISHIPSLIWKYLSPQERADWDRLYEWEIIRMAIPILRAHKHEIIDELEAASQKEEHDADKLSIFLIRHAKLDPAAAISAYEKMLDLISKMRGQDKVAATKEIEPYFSHALEAVRLKVIAEFAQQYNGEAAADVYEEEADVMLSAGDDAGLAPNGPSLAVLSEKSKPSPARLLFLENDLSLEKANEFAAKARKAGKRLLLIFDLDKTLSADNKQKISKRTADLIIEALSSGDVDIAILTMRDQSEIDARVISPLMEHGIDPGYIHGPASRRCFISVPNSGLLYSPDKAFSAQQIREYKEAIEVISEEVGVAIDELIGQEGHLPTDKNALIENSNGTLILSLYRSILKDKRKGLRDSLIKKLRSHGIEAYKGGRASINIFPTNKGDAVSEIVKDLAAMKSVSAETIAVAGVDDNYHANGVGRPLLERVVELGGLALTGDSDQERIDLDEMPAGSYFVVSDGPSICQAVLKACVKDGDDMASDGVRKKIADDTVKARTANGKTEPSLLPIQENHPEELSYSDSSVHMAIADAKKMIDKSYGKDIAAGRLLYELYDDLKNSMKGKSIKNLTDKWNKKYMPDSQRGLSINDVSIMVRIVEDLLHQLSCVSKDVAEPPVFSDKNNLSGDEKMRALRNIAKSATIVYRPEACNQCVWASQFIQRHFFHYILDYEDCNLKSFYIISDKTYYALPHVVLEVRLNGKIWIVDTQVRQFTYEFMGGLDLAEEFIGRYFYAAEEYYSKIPAFTEDEFPQKIETALFAPIDNRVTVNAVDPAENLFGGTTIDHPLKTAVEEPGNPISIIHESGEVAEGLPWAWSLREIYRPEGQGDHEKISNVFKDVIKQLPPPSLARSNPQPRISFKDVLLGESEFCVPDIIGYETLYNRYEKVFISNVVRRTRNNPWGFGLTPRSMEDLQSKLFWSFNSQTGLFEDMVDALCEEVAREWARILGEKGTPDSKLSDIFEPKLQLLLNLMEEKTKLMCPAYNPSRREAIWMILKVQEFVKEKLGKKYNDIIKGDGKAGDASKGGTQARIPVDNKIVFNAGLVEDRIAKLQSKILFNETIKEERSPGKTGDGKEPLMAALRFCTDLDIEPSMEFIQVVHNFVLKAFELTNSKGAPIHVTVEYLTPAGQEESAEDILKMTILQPELTPLEQEQLREGMAIFSAHGGSVLMEKYKDQGISLITRDSHFLYKFGNIIQTHPALLRYSQDAVSGKTKTELFIELSPKSEVGKNETQEIGSGLIGKLYTSPTERRDSTLARDIRATKEVTPEGGFLVVKGIDDKTQQETPLWDKEGRPVEKIKCGTDPIDLSTVFVAISIDHLEGIDKEIANMILSAFKGKNIYLLHDNDHGIRGAPGQDNSIYLAQDILNDPEKLFHELGESLKTEIEDFIKKETGRTISAHTFLRGCGKDVRSEIDKAFNSFDWNQDNAAEELIAHLKKALPAKRINEHEFNLIRYNAKHGYSGRELMMGLQEKVFAEKTEPSPLSLSAPAAVMTAQTIGPKALAPRPIVDCSIDKVKADQWVNAQKTEPLRRLARFIVDHITYVDQTSFETELARVVAQFAERCNGEFGVCLLGSVSNDNRQEMKSNGWTLQLALEKGLPTPAGIISDHSAMAAAQSTVKWLSDNKDVNDILFIDDASYSGAQLCDWIANAAMNISLSEDRALQTREITIHVAIPFMTNKARKMVMDLSNKLRQRGINIQIDLCDSQTIPIVKEMTDSDSLSEEDEILQSLDETCGLSSREKTLFYFQHKQPDYKSVVSPGPNRGTVLEGPILGEGEDGYVPVMPIIGKSPYQDGYAEAVSEKIGKSEWASRIQAVSVSENSFIESPMLSEILPLLQTPTIDHTAIVHAMLQAVKDADQAKVASLLKSIAEQPPEHQSELEMALRTAVMVEGMASCDKTNHVNIVAQLSPIGSGNAAINSARELERKLAAYPYGLFAKSVIVEGDENEASLKEMIRRVTAILEDPEHKEKTSPRAILLIPESLRQIARGLKDRGELDPRIELQFIEQGDMPDFVSQFGLGFELLEYKRDTSKGASRHLLNLITAMTGEENPQELIKKLFDFGPALKIRKINWQTIAEQRKSWEAVASAL